MATTKFKYLDNLPIESSLLSIADNPNTALECKSYINLGLNCNNTLSRFNSLLEFIKQDTDHPSLRDCTSFKLINLSLESYLITLLYSNTITNFDSTELTEHYCRRKIVINSNKILPSLNYAQELMFLDFKTWGGFYGTLSYYSLLKEDYEEYLTPSQLIFINTKEITSLMSNLQVVKLVNDSNNKSASQLFDLLTSLDNNLNNSSIEADVRIYNNLIEFITLIEDVDTSYSQLRFYEIWTPVIISWYLESFRQGKLEKPIEPLKNTREYKAYRVLTSIAELCLSYSLDENSFNNLPKKLIYQTIPPIFYSLFEEMVYILRSTDYELVTSNLPKTNIEKLADLFVTNINKFDKPDIVRTTSSLILDSYFPPAGYNLLTVVIASNLLNRAYILTHESNIKNSDKEIEDKDGEMVLRVSRLIYLAGSSLMKSSLEHLKQIGRNLIKTSGITVKGIKIEDLKDGR